MPVLPVPIPSAPPAPQRNDPATFEERNDAAVEYQFNTLPGAIDQQAEATYQNALEANGAAAAAVPAAANAIAAAASAAADALKTAADRQAVEDALVDGPVISVNGRSGIVTGLMEAQGGTATGLKFTVSALGNITGATTIDLATAQEFTATVTGDVTFSFTNAPAAGESQVTYLRLTDAGAHGIDWPTNTKFDTSATLSLTAGGEDLLGVKCDGGTYTVYVIGLNVGVPA